MHKKTRRFSNHESRLKIHQSMWIQWPFLQKTWTKGHWPLDDLWPHIFWGLMCDSTKGSLCLSPMKIHQSMWIQWPFLQKNLNQRSLTPRWPLTLHLLRSHVWLYPRIIVSKSHGNTLMYVDTVINFVNYHILLVIIPLRRYLEKIKGCRRLDIFHIRPWARHSRIISGSAWVFFMSMHAYHRAFSPSRANTLIYFRATEAGLNKLFCFFFVLTFSTLCRIKIISFCSFKNVKII